jgi:cysteinyl-tRNA synthetase
MHNGYLMVEGQKMSKSLGNVVLVHDLVGRAHGEAIRLALLSAHYRQPFDWTEELLQQSKRTLDRYYGLLRDASGIKAAAADAPQSFIAALEDDLNTPKAFAELAVMAKDLSTAKTAEEKARAKGVFLAAGKLIGLLQQDPEMWLKGETNKAVFSVHASVTYGMESIKKLINEKNLPNEICSDLNKSIEKFIDERTLAKQNKDYKKADQIRLDFEDAGIILEDTTTGTRWKRK